MLPPLAFEVSASVEIAAPLASNRRPAEIVTEPASPLPVDIAVICGPGSGNTMSDTTFTSTSPPLPRPPAVLAICAPPCTVRLLACTVTTPPAPDSAPVAEAAIRVLALPSPSSTSAPGVITLTEPTPPVPFMMLEISAPVLRVICGEYTVTDPALALTVEPAGAMIPVPGSLNLNGPCAATWTLPPPPVPSELDAICAPLDSVIAPPAVNPTLPARPLEPGRAEAVIALAPLGP